MAETTLNPSEAIESQRKETSQDRRFFPQSEKDQMPDEDFGDPETKSFPIKSAEDVINASMNLGRTNGDQNKIKSKIKSIAKRKGYALPKSWQNEEEGTDDKKKESSEKKSDDKEEKRVTASSKEDDDTQDQDQQAEEQAEEQAEDEEKQPPIKKKKQVAATDDTTDETSAEDSKQSMNRRDFSQSERDAMPDEDFAGPHESFPIKSQEDVHNAAKLIGHADNPDAVKSRIKAIAKKKGFKLPDAWETEEKRSQASAISEKQQQITHIQKDAMNHQVFKGSHDHHHAHMDGYSHSHSHDHVDDAHHDHSHAHMYSRSDTKISEDHTHTQEERARYKATETIDTSNRPTMYMPFTRIDAAKREVIGQATAEIPDSYGTIFAYYPKAWELWRGNIREQHDPKKAVGKRIQHFPNESEKSVDLHVRVSRGAQDTWMKVEDDVLTGFSLSVIPDQEFGNDYRKWPRKTYNGKEYPYLPRYSIAEVSLVDNPSCPGCNISIVRGDGFVTDVLDVAEEEVKEIATIERAGARVSTDTKGKIHKSIAHALHSAVSQMDNCNCPSCQSAMKVIDPDGDGDIDLGGYDDPDGDAQQLARTQEQTIEVLVTEVLERALQPVYIRLQKIAGSFSKTSQETPIEEVVKAAITRAVEAVEEKFVSLPTQSSIDEVRAELSAVKGQVEKIAEQPMPGGPVFHSGSLPTPADKRLPTDPPITYGRQSYGSVYDAIAQLSHAGQLNTPEKQTEAMAAGLIAQKQRR